MIYSNRCFWRTLAILFFVTTGAAKSDDAPGGAKSPLPLRHDPTYLAPQHLRAFCTSGKSIIDANGNEKETERLVVTVMAFAPFEDQRGEFERTFAHSAGYDPKRDQPQYLSFTAQRAIVIDEPKDPDWQPLTHTKKARWESKDVMLLSEEIADSQFVSPDLTMRVPLLIGTDLESLALHPLIPRQISKPNRKEGTLARHLLIRFFDFDVEPEKEYRYRIQLLLEDANYPMRTDIGPNTNELAPDAKMRVAGLTEQEQQGNRRQYWIRTPWSQSTEPIVVKRAVPANELGVSARPITNAKQVCAVYYEGLRLGSAGPKLILAMWPDGHIVRSENLSEGGAPYFAGTVNPARFGAIISSFENDGVFLDSRLAKPQRSNLYVNSDGNYVSILLKKGPLRLEMSSTHELTEKLQFADMESGVQREAEEHTRYEVLAHQSREYLFYRFAWNDIRLRLSHALPRDCTRVDGGIQKRAGIAWWFESPISEKK